MQIEILDFFKGRIIQRNIFKLAFDFEKMDRW